VDENIKTILARSPYVVQYIKYIGTIWKDDKFGSSSSSVLHFLRLLPSSPSYSSLPYSLLIPYHILLFPVLLLSI